MRRFFILPALLAPLNAAALTADQARLARIFITLFRAEQHCPHLRINHVAFAAAAQSAGVDGGALEPPDGPFFKEAVALYSSVEAEFGARSDQEFCEFAEDGFGPGGVIAAGLLKQR